MIDSENMRKIVKIFLIAVLCTEMQSTLTDTQADKVRVANNAKHFDFESGTAGIVTDAKYHVSIRLTTHEQHFGGGHLCSGALIAPAVVLTVAHCLYDYKAAKTRHPVELRVILGNVNRYHSDAETVIASVTHLYQPRTFDAHTLNDNIAILMLDHDIPATHLRTQPVAWDLDRQQNSTQSGFDVENSLRITSWGSSLKGMPMAQLMSLEARRLNETICLEKYRGFFVKDMHCIQMLNQNGTLCPQDAGAPLLDHNRLLIGLASFGHGCIAREYPTFYTNISQHRDWILAHIGNGSHQNGSIWGTLAFLIFTGYAIKKSNFVKIRPTSDVHH